MATTREYKARLRKQRERQQEYRNRLKLQRRPVRDDIARTVLLYFIRRTINKLTDKRLYDFMNEIAEEMQAQGFDKDQTLEVFEDLIEKYTKQKWDFRRKPHLLGNLGSAGDD